MNVKKKINPKAARPSLKQETYPLHPLYHFNDADDDEPVRMATEGDYYTPGVCLGDSAVGTSNFPGYQSSLLDAGRIVTLDSNGEYWYDPELKIPGRHWVASRRIGDLLWKEIKVLSLFPDGSDIS